MDICVQLHVNHAILWWCLEILIELTISVYGYLCAITSEPCKSVMSPVIFCLMLLHSSTPLICCLSYSSGSLSCTLCFIFSWLLQIWPPKNVKDSGSRLHSLLKEAIMLVRVLSGTKLNAAFTTMS